MRRPRVFRALGFRRDDRCQRQAGDGLDERRVERRAREAVPDQPDPEWLQLRRQTQIRPAACRWVRAIASITTAASSTAPVTMNFTDDWSASRSMPFAIEVITSAPSSACHTLPRPPNRLVPAITGPAIASSRKSPAPEDWFTASRRDAAMMPPMAAMVEATMKTITRTRVTLMPARRAASALPPTAKMWRPNVVLVVM